MIEVERLSLQYADAAEPALVDVSLRVAPGELVLVTGPTGCGKSSLLNCLNGIVQHESSARLEGIVRLDGRDLRAWDLAEVCRTAGTVFQNPDSQICTATPETEIAFGLENLGVDRATMTERIGEALAVVGLGDCRRQPTATLSGGQKQRLAIACALALKPKVLLLDEPISQVDPRGVGEILRLVARLRAEAALTVVLVEHRVEETVALADRVVLMDRGRIVLDRPRDAALADLAPLRRLGLNLPLLADLFERLGRSERPLRPGDAPRLSVRRPDPRPPRPRAEPLCEVRRLGFRHGRHAPALFDDLNLTLHRGDRVALMGPNGSGKSTLLDLLAGLRSPRSGEIAWRDGPAPSVGLVLQAPDLMLFCESVRDEVAFAPKHARLPKPDRQRIVDSVLARLGLADLAGQSPFALSRGQRLRTAVASILAKRPAVLLLDEPTTGQDREQIERMMTALEHDFELVVFCTHDVQTAARHANRIVLLDAGRIVADGEPADVLFDEAAVAAGAIRPTSLQTLAGQHGVRALDVDSMLELVQP